MLTGKQQELIQEFYSQISESDISFYSPIIDYLLELSYIPQKHKKSNFAIKFVNENNRILVKIEIRQLKDGKKFPVFWLRYSACDDYSAIFQDAVKKLPDGYVFYPDPAVCCGLCKGHPRYYFATNDEGVVITRCGGVTLPVEGVSRSDLPEILRLIKEQNEYFAKYLKK